MKKILAILAVFCCFVVAASAWAEIDIGTGSISVGGDAASEQFYCSKCGDGRMSAWSLAWFASWYHQDDVQLGGSEKTDERFCSLQCLVDHYAPKYGYEKKVKESLQVEKLFDDWGEARYKVVDENIIHYSEGISTWYTHIEDGELHEEPDIRGAMYWNYVDECFEWFDPRKGKLIKVQLR